MARRSGLMSALRITGLERQKEGIHDFIISNPSHYYMDSKTETMSEKQSELYEFYQLMRWLKTIKVYPDDGAGNRWVYRQCKILYKQGVLDKEEEGQGILYSLSEAPSDF